MERPPPPPPPPPGSYQSPHPGLANPPTDGQATTSLVLGILSVVPCCWLGIVLGPIAFFLGQGALNRINASGGTLGGAGLAQAGRVLGIIGAVLGLLVVVAFVVAFAISAASAHYTY